MHINNLYKNQDILEFKRCYALEKIHGTSAHIAHKVDKGLWFFAGGVKHDDFIKIFDQEFLAEALKGLNVTIYGEAYGGKCQKMSDVYGPELKFVAFDVNIDGCWLAVPQADKFVKNLNLEFVDYVLIPTDLDKLNEQRDRPSTQAIRNGIGDDKEREGVVLRPIFEVTKNNGSRVIAKHKAEKFRETKTARQITPEKLQILNEANAVAEEWVTEMRLQHVLDKMPNVNIEHMSDIIKNMIKDIEREGEGEIEWSKAVSKAVARNTAQMAKRYFKSQIKSV